VENDCFFHDSMDIPGVLRGKNCELKETLVRSTQNTHTNTLFRKFVDTQTHSLEKMKKKNSTLFFNLLWREDVSNHHHYQQTHWAQTGEIIKEIIIIFWIQFAVSVVFLLVLFNKFWWLNFIFSNWMMKHLDNYRRVQEKKFFFVSSDDTNNYTY
jgi:hypothetical protein